MHRNFRGRWIIINSGAGIDVSQPVIQGVEFGADVDNFQIAESAIRFAKSFFHEIDNLAAYAHSLAVRVDGEHSEIAALSAQFHIDTADEARRVFGQQELSFFHQAADGCGIRAIPLDEKLLDEEGRVDQPSDCPGIILCCGSYRNHWTCTSYQLQGM